MSGSRKYHQFMISAELQKSHCSPSLSILNISVTSLRDFGFGGRFPCLTRWTIHS
ncbi:hypothetical protein C0J52_11119 [Blattella germanica]|nr:hypothetical protein C0J52_11119 [Blattella germanica]